MTSIYPEPGSEDNDIGSLVLSKRAVVFDVDGTLYDHSLLKRKMIIALVKYYSKKPWQLYDLKILADFRCCREELAMSEATDIHKKQFDITAKRTSVSVRRVEQVVDKWIMQEPLQFLPSVRYSGIRRFLGILRRNGLKLAAFSDYPVKDKVEALDLFFHYQLSATDPSVCRFKPHPAGLEIIAEQLGLHCNECVMIGDRKDKDGACARRAGMPFLHMNARSKGSEQMSFADYEYLVKACQK